MLKLGRKVEYALISLYHLDSLAEGELVASREIGERYKVPQDVLGKVLQALNRAELIVSVQGAKGGYLLKQPLAEIALGDVVEAVEGPVNLAKCTCRTPERVCPQQACCNIRDRVHQLQSALNGFLFSFRLDSFTPESVMCEEPAL